MKTAILVPLILILSVNQSSSNININCVKCLEHSKIFIRNLSPHSPFPYQCVNESKNIFLGTVVVARACEKWECMFINRENKRVYNKSTLCVEEDPCVRDHNNSVGKVIFSLNSLLLLFITLP